MYPAHPEPPARANRRGLKIALIGAGVVGGVIGATALAANAQTAGTGSTATAYTPANSSATGAPGTPGAAGRPPANRHGAAPVRSDEKAVSAAIAAQLKAAALKAVPDATVYRVETDAGDGVYEAHLTKADGTEVTVKFDKSLKVTKVESGMGSGDPRPSR